MGKIFFAFGAILGSIILSISISPSFSLALAFVLPSLTCLLVFFQHLMFQESSGQIENCKQAMSDLARESLDSYNFIVALSEELHIIAKFAKLQESTKELQLDQKVA